MKVIPNCLCYSVSVDRTLYYYSVASLELQLALGIPPRPFATYQSSMAFTTL